MEETKRIRKFKAELIRDLPFFPNNRETKQELEAQSLNSVLFHYLHWSLRKVPPRPRKVIISPDVTSDSRWRNLSGDIQALLDKVRNGEDLSPHLSLKAHTKGYTPADRIRNGEADSWDDKDFVLNTKGFYHFHLDMTIEQSGMSGRTDDVLFAFVTREDFHAIGIFDHSVFDRPDDDGIALMRRQLMFVSQKNEGVIMNPSDYNPMAREAFGRGLLDIASAIFKGVFLLLTVAPLAAFLKSMLSDSKDRVSILEIINSITYETQIIFIGLFVMSISIAFYARREGLRHLHELEEIE